MAKPEYKGQEFLYLVEVPGTDPETDPATKYRVFNQTGGSTTSEAGEVELNTKDKTGSDYANITQNISIEGVLTQGDEAIKHIKKAQRMKQFVNITEVNTRTGDAETGSYMITSFERSFGNAEFATYTIEGALNGDITEENLTDIPDGAPGEIV